jgi:hypothetical protein
MHAREKDMTMTLERTDVDANTLDRVEVRYRVAARFEFNTDGRDFFIATADISLTAGLYSGVPDKACIAALVASRGVYAEELDLTGTTLTRDAVEAMIAERGVMASDIRSARIEEVVIDDQVVATALED